MPAQTPARAGTAPPQTPGAMALARQGGETAVAAKPQLAQGVSLVSVAGRGEVERVEVEVTLPAGYQYEVPTWKRNGTKPDGKPKFERVVERVGITSDGYLYLNRVLGVTFVLPEKVPDRDGTLALNPILRKDYIRLRMQGLYYNVIGQLVLDTVDIETDFNLVWMDARINAKSAEIVMDENGLPRFDDFGNPAVKLTKEDELSALKQLSSLRTFGIRYAQTVAQVRLMKMATGLKSLPMTGVRDMRVKIVAYRDHMTPDERLTRAGSTLNAMYGRPADFKPLSADEMSEVEAEDRDHGEDEDTARVAEEARQRQAEILERQPDDEDDPGATAKPVGPDGGEDPQGAIPWAAELARDVQGD